MRIGLSNFLSRLLAALNGTEYFIASWIAIFTIEKFGRRKLMLFGAVGQSLSMVVLAASSKYSDVNKSAGITAAVFLFVFNSFFAVGWLGMTWLYPSEITPLVSLLLVLSNNIGWFSSTLTDNCCLFRLSGLLQTLFRPLPTGPLT